MLKNVNSLAPERMLLTQTQRKLPASATKALCKDLVSKNVRIFKR
jgi:hypothetical protein